MSYQDSLNEAKELLKVRSEAERKFTKARHKVEKELKLLVKNIESEVFGDLLKDIHNGRFNVNTDGGSAGSSWEPFIWFQDPYVLSEKAHYQLTNSNTWLKIDSGPSFEKYEVKEGPFDIALIYKAASMIEDQTKLKVHVGTVDLSNTNYINSYGKTTLLDGTVIEPKREISEYDYED